MQKVEIQSVSNGYICKKADGWVTVYRSFDEVLEYLLLIFEGKSKEFSGESWGRVVTEKLEGALTPDAADEMVRRGVGVVVSKSEAPDLIIDDDNSSRR